MAKVTDRVITAVKNENMLSAEALLEQLDIDGRSQLTPLAIAGLTCNVANLKKILNSKENDRINEFCGTEELKLTPLQWCFKNDLSSNMFKCVQLLIEAGADVNIKELKEGRNTVHMAANQDLPEVLMLLIDHGGDVNVPDMKNNIPLHYLCQTPETTQSLKCVHRLIKDTTNINARNGTHETPFFIAVTADNCQMVKDLADSGCDINACCLENNEPPLSAAVMLKETQNPESKMIEQLINLGCDVNGKNKAGMTPLMQAAASRDPESVKILLKHGADMNAKDMVSDPFSELKGSSSVIDHCFEYTEENPKSAKDTLEIFLQSDPDINIANLSEKHLQKIMWYGDSQTLDFLVVNGFDIHHIGERDENLLHFLPRACKAVYKFSHLCDQLDVNHKDAYGDTPIMVAIEELGRFMEYFLDRNADVNIVNKDGQSALMVCAENNPREIKALLDAGSDLHVKDNNGQTAVQYLDTDDMELYNNSLKLFLQHGGAASMDIKTTSGFTPLQNVLKTERFSMFWHLVAENCSLESLETPRSDNDYDDDHADPPSILYHMRNDTVKLGKILYLCGVQKEIIQEKLDFLYTQEKRFHRFCNNMPLKKLCRRVVRNYIGAGIQQKLSKDSRIPGSFHDFIMLKDIFNSKVFDPNQISEYSFQDKNNVCEGVTLSDDDDNDDDEDDDDSDNDYGYRY